MTDKVEGRSSSSQASHSARPAHLHDFSGYLKDPRAIYAQSFEIVKQEADLSQIGEDARPMAIRLIHACGMPEIASDLRISEKSITSGQRALKSGKPVLCDVEMVAHGITRRFLPANVDVISTLNDHRVPALAQQLGTTRSAAAVELWRDRIEGSIVAIGNAPTALFHLLERLQEGWPRPALILGFPVGFVGAAESKDALIAHANGVEYATLLGRKGGSAMAAAAVNALSLGLSKEIKTKRRVMWIENKSQGTGLAGPARIGWVSTTSSGKGLRYDGKLFLSLQGSGFKANYFEESSGDEYWISGCRKDGRDALYSTSATIDADAAEEYWVNIRQMPERIETLKRSVIGKNK